MGRVVELGTYQPIANAQLEAILGDDGVLLTDFSDINGEFSMEGQAGDSGTLSLTITADGYQTYSSSLPQTGSRIYNLADLPLVPQADSCNYESVINLLQPVALARLQSLNFTQVSTTSIMVNDGSGLDGRVITQTPEPPPEGETSRVNCQMPIILGIGVQDGE
jgi:hypothetical protein